MSQSGTKKYWKGIEELTEQDSFVEQSNKEFSEYIPVEDFMGDENTLNSSTTSRRDFLKFLGFSVTAATVASCETPVTKAIPYLVKPEEVTPGIANYYASTYFDGYDYASILVKTREGRPILIEGNKMSSVTNGAVNARVNSSVLSLYDANRLQGPRNKEGNDITWSDLDAGMAKAIEAAAAGGGKIRLLTNTVISPSTLALVDKFKEKYAGADVNHVMYDSISYSGIIEANEESFGISYTPNYNFAKAKTIVGFGADFLSTWLSSNEYAGQYGMNRKPEGAWMSRHHQFETGLSVTGSNADYRTALKPSEMAGVVISLHNAIAGKMGASTISGGSDAHKDAVQRAATDLVSTRGAGIVVCGSNDKNLQIVVNSINNMLGNYGKTIELDHPSYLRKGKDGDIKALVDEMKSGGVDVLIVANTDPAKTLPAAMDFAGAMAKVKTSVCMTTYASATSAMATYTGAENHFLESWNDANPKPGHYSLAQPSISKLYETRQYQESLLKWTEGNTDYRSFIKSTWADNMEAESLLFEATWNKALHDGVYEMDAPSEHEVLEFSADVAAAASAIKKAGGSGMELFLYQKTGIGDGAHAGNPWLQELPDPITKITWDNYVTMAPEDMEEAGYNVHLGQEQKSNVVKLTAGGTTIEAVPVVAQPGQARGTLGLALGYGQKTWAMSEAIGVNAYPMVGFNGNISYEVMGASIENTGSTYHLAATQTSHTVMGRTGVVRETDIATYKSGDRNAFNPPTVLPTHDGDEHVRNLSLWEPHPTEEVTHLWGMSIDLNSCIGCGACVTACNAENNVPVVGKDEVRRGREMHWLRIDRYYSTDADLEDKSIGGYREMENPAAQPEVVFQPMMCQHCNHAPCETVCPVAATTHSKEGLNMMTYNRCIGTRYCANNCPYKVRRFNWFNYMADSKFTESNPAQDDLGRMVLNPDVTVRARGVMEKCSLCVQRIQAGKLAAKKDGTKVQDGAIQTACSSACPSHAITFGDLNDESSEVAKAEQSDRMFRVIEEVGTRPNILYQLKVRNKEQAKA